jgi:hypothetical protein
MMVVRNVTAKNGGGVFGCLDFTLEAEQIAANNEAKDYDDGNGKKGRTLTFCQSIADSSVLGPSANLRIIEILQKSSEQSSVKDDC